MRGLFFCLKPFQDLWFADDHRRNEVEENEVIITIFNSDDNKFIMKGEIKYAY